jgi:hypothetical protein
MNNYVNNMPELSTTPNSESDDADNRHMRGALEVDGMNGQQQALDGIQDPQVMNTSHVV